MSLKALVDTPVYDCRDFDAVPVIDAAAALDEEGNVTVFCVNRDMSEDFCLQIDLRSFGEMKLSMVLTMFSDGRWPLGGSKYES